MGNDNIDNFMKNSSIHIANLNRNLRNAKSKVLVDFIHSDLLCYDLKPLKLDNRTTLVLSNTRKLDRELFYKLVYLI